jgi:D-cysteine desulfhydrase
MDKKTIRMVNTNLERLPRTVLGFFPTPLVPLKRLSAYLNGPEIWMKRDDLSGLAFGGNKTRKLEYLLGDAIAAGCDTLVTGGADQSNHCRQTAAAAACCNLECHLALGGSAPHSMNGNLLLDHLFGAHIHWSGSSRKGENIPLIAEELRASGKIPYMIPYGGSNRLGAAGFVQAAGELDMQISELNGRITHIVFASSSGGTHAGLMAGMSLFCRDICLAGIAVDKEGPDGRSLDEIILELAVETALLLGIEPEYSLGDVLLRKEYAGEGYGVVGAAEREAISLTARLEGVLLDPVYTGKAMAGLIDMARKHELTKHDRVLFWHTGGGPSLFSYADELA